MLPVHRGRAAAAASSGFGARAHLVPVGVMLQVVIQHSITTIDAPRGTSHTLSTLQHMARYAVVGHVLLLLLVTSPIAHAEGYAAPSARGAPWGKL
jgi:hypothetical protein